MPTQLELWGPGKFSYTPQELDALSEALDEIEEFERSMAKMHAEARKLSIIVSQEAEKEIQYVPVRS